VSKLREFFAPWSKKSDLIFEYTWWDYVWESRWPTTCWKEDWYGNYQWYINCSTFPGMWGIRDE
jgi:hypothetical protein